MFLFINCNANEYFYSCLDKGAHDCPLDFFVLEVEPNEMSDLNPNNIKGKISTIHQEDNLLGLHSGDSNKCWKIERQDCLFELQRYYELFNLGLLPFPFSKKHKYLKEKSIIHINMNEDATSNATREICEHFISAFVLAISLKVMTDSIVWPISGVVLYVGVFAISSKIYKWWSEKTRKYF